MKRWFLSAAARARGQFNDLNREILASNLFNCLKEVINTPPFPSISRRIHIVYRHKNVWEYQWSNFIYNCMSTFLHYVRCKDALLDCSPWRWKVRITNRGWWNCLWTEFITRTLRMGIFSPMVPAHFVHLIKYRSRNRHRKQSGGQCFLLMTSGLVLILNELWSYI